MATQTIHFESFPQCNAVKLFSVGSDTVVASGASVAMGTNDPSAGTCTVTDVAAGLYKVVCFQGSTALSYQYVDLELATGDYFCRDTIEGDVRTSSRAAPGAEMDLVDAPNAAAVTALQNGVSTFNPANDTVARVTLVDTCTANTDMRGTDGAITSLSGIATATDVTDAAGDVIAALPDVSGLALETTAQSIKTKTDAIPSAGDIATAVWSASTRTLSSFGTLVSDIATAVWGATTRTLSGFSHKVTVEANEDKAGYSLQTSPPTKEAIAGQVRTELATELGRINVDLSSRLAPTEAGRTLDVGADGKVVADATIDPDLLVDPMRDAMGLEEGQRVATPEDLSVNVVTTPLSVSVRKDIEQSTLYLRLDDTSEYRIEEVKGSDGVPVDLSLIANLELVIESFDEVEVEVITDLELINDNHGVAFSPSVAVQTATYPPKHHLWALRDPDDGNRVLAGGPCVVSRYARRA